MFSYPRYYTIIQCFILNFILPYWNKLAKSPVLHYRVVYIFSSFLVTEPIPGFLEIDMRVTDEA